MPETTAFTPFTVTPGQSVYPEMIRDRLAGARSSGAGCGVKYFLSVLVSGGPVIATALVTIVSVPEAVTVGVLLEVSYWPE